MGEQRRKQQRKQARQQATKRVQLTPAETDRFQMVGDELDTHYYCTHRGRTYPVGLVRLVKQGSDVLQLCPYDGCDGDAVFDVVAWRDMLEADPKLPEVPEWGVEYFSREAGGSSLREILWNSSTFGKYA